jgi:hypothetical protein
MVPAKIQRARRRPWPGKEWERQSASPGLDLRARMGQGGAPRWRLLVPVHGSHGRTCSSTWASLAGQDTTTQATMGPREGVQAVGRLWLQAEDGARRRRRQWSRQRSVSGKGYDPRDGWAWRPYIGELPLASRWRDRGESCCGTTAASACARGREGTGGLAGNTAARSGDECGRGAWQSLGSTYVTRGTTHGPAPSGARERGLALFQSV